MHGHVLGLQQFTTSLSTWIIAFCPSTVSPPGWFAFWLIRPLADLPLYLACLQQFAFMEMYTVYTDTCNQNKNQKSQTILGH